MSRYDRMKKAFESSASDTHGALLRIIADEMDDLESRVHGITVRTEDLETEDPEPEDDAVAVKVQKPRAAKRAKK